MANEKRLIDANKAKFFIADVLDIFKIPVGDRMASKLIDTIDALPTVDAVEVVRCKDCVKRETVLCPLETYDDFPWRASREDDFCSYGEKRNDQ